MDKVSVIRCGDYACENIDKAVKAHFDNLGGLERFVKAGEKVLVKPNLISPKPVNQPAQTHPAIILAVAKLLIESGALVTVADSPAWSDTTGCLKAIDVYDELISIGAEVKDLNKPKRVRLPYTGLTVSISKTALEADKIINLPKLKTHQQMTATIAVKNMFGAVTGKRKALWHYRQGKNAEQFASMLLDIFFTVKPVINIVDAVDAMEGQGPINGKLRHIGLTVASEDALACEYVCSRVINIDPQKLPIVAATGKFSVGVSGFDDIELIGESFEDLICEDFVQAEIVPVRFTLPRICKSVVKQILILIKNSG